VDVRHTIRYDSVYLTCSKKLTGSQLSLPHVAYIANNLRTERPSMPKFGRRLPTLDATRILVLRSKVRVRGGRARRRVLCWPNPAATLLVGFAFGYFWTLVNACKSGARSKQFILCMQLIIVLVTGDEAHFSTCHREAV